MGVLFQMNAEALRKKGFFAGKELKGNEGLVSQGLISFIGSDSHSVDLRPPEIAFAADRIRKLNPEMADQIISGNARDLVSGKIL